MLRNREFRQFAIWFSVLAAIVITAGFAISGAAGVLVAASSAAFFAMFCVFTKDRYDKIARISEQIDQVLHRADHLYIGECEEGELSVLHSEITKMTLRIREQNDELKRDKLHLADSLADIAHQLKTPLTSVNLLLTLLQSSGEERERKIFLREIEELLVRMDFLITSLLKLSRLDAGVVLLRKEQIEGRKLIKAALLPLLIPMELHGVKVEIQVPEGIVILGDFGWLTEAVQNILKNCMESAGENGKIEITGADTPLFTELAIHDSGAGFQEEPSFLFDRFYQGKNQKTAGYGIGLALTKTIITRLDGTITAKNHPQGGAYFVIRFPK